MKLNALPLVAMSSLLFLSASCGKSENAKSSSDNQATLVKSKIINGDYDAVNNEKNVVAVFGGNSLCTGTIIHPYLVLTAAHCVEDKIQGVLMKTKFSTSTYNLDEIIPAHKSIANPRYQKSARNQEKNDIAVIVLKEKAPIDEKDIIPLLTHDEEVQFNIREGSKATIVGYGKNESHRVTGHRRTKEVTVRDSFFCHDDEISNVFNFSLGAHSGDSGGPAFFKFNGRKRQIGVASTGRVKGVSYGIGEIRTPEFCQRSNYTNVVRHLGWIKSVVGYYPGVNNDELSQTIAEKYDFAKKLKTARSGTPAKLKLSAGATLRVQFDGVMIKDGYGSANIFLRTFFCPDKKGKKCRKVESSGVYNISKKREYSLGGSEMIVSMDDIKEMQKDYGKGTIRFSLMEDPGTFSRNIVVKSVSIPANLGYNFSQRNLDKNKNLKRSTFVEDKKAQFELSIELDD